MSKKLSNDAKRAMRDLAWQIRRLPHGPGRTEFEIQHCELGRNLNPAAYQSLHGKVTAARFAVATADLADLKAEVGTLDPILADRLTKWEKGPEGWASIEGFFAEAASIATALDEILETAPKLRPAPLPRRRPAQPFRRFSKPDAMRSTGKTAANRASGALAQHAANISAAAARNQGHKKGKSPDAPKGKGGGKKKK